MGLSEQRQRQRLVGSARAKNDAWLSDTSLPGQRLLASMGWAPGAGLGTERQGMSSNLSMALKLDNKGIGAHRHEREALQSGKADAWTGAGGELGSLFDRLNAANAQSEKPKPAEKRKESKKEARSKETEDVARPAPTAAAARLAHRAKFRRAKQMVGTDASSLNEILGISSAEASARSSPAAEEKTQPQNVRALPELSSNSEQSSDSGQASKRRKGKDEDEKRSKKRSKERTAEKGEKSSKEKRAKKRSKEEKRAAKKLAKEDRLSKEKDRSAKKRSKEEKRAKKRAKEEKRSKRAEATSAEHGKGVQVAPKHQPDAFEEAQAITPSTQFVFEYLSRKLLLRKAEVHRRKCEREADVWRRAQTVGRM